MNHPDSIDLTHQTQAFDAEEITCGAFFQSQAGQSCITGKTQKGRHKTSFCVWRATQDSNLRPTGS